MAVIRVSKRECWVRSESGGCAECGVQSSMMRLCMLSLSCPVLSCPASVSSWASPSSFAGQRVDGKRQREGEKRRRPGVQRRGDG